MFLKEKGCFSKFSTEKMFPKCFGSYFVRINWYFEYRIRILCIFLLWEHISNIVRHFRQTKSILCTRSVNNFRTNYLLVICWGLLVLNGPLNGPEWSPFDLFYWNFEIWNLEFVRVKFCKIGILEFWIVDVWDDDILIFGCFRKCISIVFKSKIWKFRKSVYIRFGNFGFINIGYIELYLNLYLNK